jgi:pimeloyl-ACP methyl ester carboxylesterase
VVLGFGDGLELDSGRYELRRDGVPVSLEPQAFDVLAYLAAHRDRLVPKNELMDAVWGGRFVTEAAVTSRIKQARRAVGDDGQAQQVIRTVHGRGYRFVAPVTVLDGPRASPAAGRFARQVSRLAAPIRYTLSDGLHVAYQVTGGGDRDIVLISGFVSHLEIDWADPRHARFLDGLGAMGRLIRFDKRGTGMSDRPPGVPDLETRMHDVLAVMDEIGSARAVLWGYSEGGPMSVLLAAAHPERVESLVLYGSYAKRTWAPDYPWTLTAREHADYTERLLVDWDWEADCRRRCPSADEAMQHWWAQRIRAAATPATIRALMDMNALVDVRHALPAVRVPTLVLHRTGDQVFGADEARYLAQRIPGARLQLLDGDDHLPCGDPDQILDAVRAFLDTAGEPVGEATLPSQAQALAAVAAVAGADDAVLVDQLVARGGRLRRDPAGRPLVLFDGPATAVRAGIGLVSRTARVGLSIAEVARDGPEVAGSGVRLAERLADAAPVGSLAVSSGVAMLLAPSGVVLETLKPLDDGEPMLRVASA